MHIELKNAIRNDYYRMTGQKWKLSFNSLIKITFMHNIRFMRVWRKQKCKFSFFRKLKLYIFSRKYGLEISDKANIGSGLYLGHPYNITIAGGVSIGNNCNIHKGCTIGRENRGTRKGVPSLGNKVYLGINSTVVGKIRIGNDVFIAPNTFVNFDVPDHCVVVGNPGVIHFKENATADYIRFEV